MLSFSTSTVTTVDTDRVKSHENSEYMYVHNSKSHCIALASIESKSVHFESRWGGAYTLRSQSPTRVPYVATCIEKNQNRSILHTYFFYECELCIRGSLGITGMTGLVRTSTTDWWLTPQRP